MNLTAKIKHEFGSLKRYARVRGLGYGSLRCFIAGDKSRRAVANQLVKDGFLTAQEAAK